jgi:two-component system sensor histidine kinase/response regulator
MTANAFASDREAAIESGMNDHVAKPIDVGKLFNVIAAQVTVPEHRRSRLQLDDGDEEREGEVADTGEALSIEGIDTDTAIQRCGGNATLYRELLLKFTAAQADARTRLEQEFADGDYVQLEIDAHTIKGVAANLGITQLSREAEVLELALKVGGDISPGLIEDLSRELERILARISAVAGVDDIAPGTSAATSDDEPLSELMAKLVSLLEDYDLDAGKVVQQIKLQLSDSIASDSMVKIEALLGKYDFEGALELAVKIEAG